MDFGEQSERKLDSGRVYFVDDDEIPGYNPDSKQISITKYKHAGVPDVGEIITLRFRSTGEKIKAQVLNVTSVEGGSRRKYDLEIIPD